MTCISPRSETCHLWSFGSCCRFPYSPLATLLLYSKVPHTLARLAFYLHCAFFYLANRDNFLLLANRSSGPLPLSLATTERESAVSVLSSERGVALWQSLTCSSPWVRTTNVVIKEMTFLVAIIFFGGGEELESGVTWWPLAFCY